MKKLTVAIVTLLLMAFALTLFAGCEKSHDIRVYEGDDLTENATISASDNNDDAGRLVDGKSKKWSSKKQGAYIDITFAAKTAFNTIVLREPSDSVYKFTILVKGEDGEYEEIYTQDRIDKYRMCAIEDTVSDGIRIVFDEFDGKVQIEEIEVFNIKNMQQQFVRQGYFPYSAGEAAARKNDADFISSLNVITDIILYGTSATTEGEVVGDKDKIKADIDAIKEITGGRVKTHLEVSIAFVPGDFNGTNKAIVKFSKEKLDTYLKNLKDFVEYVGADGVDYDWEYPQLPHEWDAYDKILIGTKKAIGGRQLSVALWPYGVGLSKEAKACIDKVNAMAYDQFDERGNHSSIYECGLWAIDYFVSKGFAKSQILLGLPFYGRTTDERSYWPNYTEEYGKFGNFEKDHKYSDDEGEHISDVYLSGYAEIRDKTALAIAMDISGIMIWHFGTGLDYSYEYSLIRAVEESAVQRLATP